MKTRDEANRGRRTHPSYDESAIDDATFIQWAERRGAALRLFSDCQCKHGQSAHDRAHPVTYCQWCQFVIRFFLLMDTDKSHFSASERTVLEAWRGVNG